MSAGSALLRCRVRLPGRLALLALLAASLGACATKPVQLYAWEDFPTLQYVSLMRDGSKGPDEQLQALEAQAVKSRAAGVALPPGFRAHMGLLYLQAGNIGRARESWLAEKSAFPESAPYMDRLIQKLDTPPPAPAAAGG